MAKKKRGKSATRARTRQSSTGVAEAPSRRTPRYTPDSDATSQELDHVSLEGVAAPVDDPVDDPVVVDEPVFVDESAAVDGAVETSEPRDLDIAPKTIERSTPPEASTAVAQDASAEPRVAEKKERSWQWSWTNLLRLRMQIVLSALAGVSVGVVSLTVRPLSFGDLATYLAILLGIASVLALVGSITFGFLTYYAQAIQAEKTNLYARFRDGVKDLRDFLDDLYEAGVIDGEYDYHFGLIAEVTAKDFPLMSWGERVTPLIHHLEIQREDLDHSGSFGRVLRGVAYRVNTIEETIQELFKNFVGQILVKRMTDPVLKSFGTLAVVMLVVLLAPLTFDVVPRVASWSLSTSLAFMTFALLVEQALVVRREMREFDVTTSSDD